jgi:hypothetical protein
MKELSLGPHDWLLGVFREISDYAKLNNLPETFHAVSLAHASLEAEAESEKRLANNVLALNTDWCRP